MASAISTAPDRWLVLYILFPTGKMTPIPPRYAQLGWFLLESEYSNDIDHEKSGRIVPPLIGYDVT